MSEPTKPAAHRLLVGHDGSPRAPAVLRAAVALARRLEGKILLFRAVGLPAEIPHDLYGLAPEELTARFLEHATRALDDAARDVPPELLAGVRAVMGPPWQSLCQAAKDCDASCIVIGSHGYGVMDHVLGTTAAKVVNHADRSVLVVRRPEALE
jgi:universal stress protein F